MDGIRAWSATVCLAALGCAAVQLLAPKGSLGKVFRLVIHTFFLLCMLLPLLRMGALQRLDIEGLPPTIVEDLLEDTVTKQLETQVTAAVESVTAEVLAQRGVTAEKIEVYTDISEEGGIYIQHVTVAVDKQSVPQAKLAGEVLERQLETTVEIVAK